jgi:protein-S-isoprenylcysteine O-methyltransferase Ste14
MTELPFRILVAMLLMGMIAIGAPHRYRAEKAGGHVPRTGEGRFMMFGLRITGAVVWLTILLYIAAPSMTSWAMLPLPPWLRLLGAPLAMAALGWCYWVFRSLGLNVTDTVAVRDRAQLVTSGPYRWVRHPLYAGLPVVLGSLFLLTANWLVLFGGAIVMGFLVVRTRIEERNLVARFGEDYRVYMGRTGRFFPRLGLMGGRTLSTG